MTDQEINEAVARKLGKPDKESLLYQKPLDYCHSIAAAWEILTHCYADLDLQYGLTQNPSTLNIHCHIGYTEALADTAPMAICLAFLKLDQAPAK